MASGDKAAISRAITQMEDQCIFPGAAIQVMTLLRDPNASIRDLERTIGSDGLLTGRLLRFANSPYYGRSGKIKTLKRALMVLGFREVRQIALAMALHAMGRKCKKQHQTLWEHSMTVAIASREIARYNRKIESGELFVAGLLHDIGMLVLLQLEPEKYAPVVDRIEEGSPLQMVEEKKQFGFDHTELAAGCMSRWKLPEELCFAVSHHHKVRILNRPGAAGLILPAIIGMGDVVARLLHKDYPADLMAEQCAADPLNGIVSMSVEHYEMVAKAVIDETQAVFGSVST